MSGKGTSARARGPRGVLRRDRVTGQIAIGLVGVLCVGALVYGVGTASARYKLADVGAWLSAGAKGLVVHANGLAGKVDGKTAVIPQMRGHHIKIVQDGATVLLIDEDTGVVSRIDPSQLKITQSRALGGSALQVVAGAGAAYTVDLAKGAVQQIDPLKLTPIGQAAALTAPLAKAGIDARGTLWVPTPQDGKVVPFQNGRQGTPVTVGRGGDHLALTIAAGAPVVTDGTAATALIVRPEGAQKINLPAPVAKAGDAVKVPEVADGSVVPILGTGGSLYLLDTGVGRVSSIALRMARHQLDAPHVLGPRVYLPDRTTGRLLVFNTDRNAWERPITATRPGGTIEVLVRDHMLWVNDPNGSTALAFDQSGAVRRIQKYDDKIPGGARRPIPAPNPGNGNGNRNNGGGRGPGGSTGANPQNPPNSPNRPAQPPPKKDPTAPDPPTPAASGDNGAVTVRFTPAAQPQGVYPVTRFVLLDQSDRPVTAASPSQFPGTSQGGTFTVRGLACDTTTHMYKVAAEYKGKDNRTAYSPSGEVGATACQAPMAAPVLDATAKNHTASLSWSQVPGYQVTYKVTGPNAPSGRLSGTSTDVGGLTNGAGQTYTYTVTASNGAGETTSAPKSVTLDPAKGSGSYNMHWDDDTNTLIRSEPSPTAGRVGSIPKGYHGAVTVHCQRSGPRYTDTFNSANRSSVIWNQITYNGVTGWISDLFVVTSGSGTDNFSPPLWECT
ncbi:fibronectin type III domain-containing protein [Actinomadura fibrosa]|uniref:Fibronectin type-III domain-containing protein n=1 Tax=Actinomadura fibrosa TaxID=111802 RepID=A0ABW2XF64_9ACTN|nr:fibronectin type III domain-containing protein [Actinomadura fibrosa]